MINVRLKDSSGTQAGAEMHERDSVSGQVVYTREYAERENARKPLVNDVYGTAMHQNATFGGTPVNIHDGGDAAGWTGTATAGTWAFADTTNPSAGTACVSLTSANNNDSANFAGTTIAGSSYSAITLQIRLETYDPANNSIRLQFSNSGVPVGAEVLIDDYINITTIGAYQPAIIPLSDLTIENESFDECDITVDRAGGTKPTFRIDEFQIEETGGGVRFEVRPAPRHVFYVNRLWITWIDNTTGNASLDYSKILGATLTNGISFVRKTKSGSSSVLIADKIGDFYRAGFTRKLIQDDGANTILTVELCFDRAIALNSLYDDYIYIEINDDLSGLINMTAVASGEEETINGGRKLIL